MANTIEYAKVYQQQLDTLATQEMTTGWMEANAGQVKYNGGNEIKIPKMSLDGLADYDRATGYPDGTVTLTYETKQMTQDRGKKFRLDAMDVDETNFATTGASVMGTFQRDHVVPEVDAYRIATLYGAAKTAGNVTESYTPAKDTIVEKLKADITKVRKAGAKNVVVHISFDALGALETALATQLHNTTWSQGGINTQVPTFDGAPLIATADDRMYAKVTIDPDDGYSGEGNINWIVMDSRVPIAVSKTDKVKIIDPDTNQSADAWDLTYRKYHDIWVMDNKAKLVAACLSGTAPAEG